MSRNLIDEFRWIDIQEQKNEILNDEEKYERIVRWARQARESNPKAFDGLTQWILETAEVFT